MRLTPRRWALIAVSGVVLVAVLALINYLVPGTGHSDIGHFAGQVMHGGAGPTLRRKIAANLGSLTANPFVLVIPVVVIVAGAMVARPAMLRAESVAGAYRAIPLLQPALAAIWLAGCWAGCPKTPASPCPRPRCRSCCRWWRRCSAPCPATAPRQAPASGNLLPRPFDRCRQVHGYG